MDAASASGAYGTSSTAGWCSGPPEVTTKTNLSARGKVRPGIKAGPERKFAPRLFSSWCAASWAANVPAGGSTGAGAEEAAATSANVARPAARRRSSI
eukprot:3060681-Alexandrium_andersonii.AAC.1